MKNPYIQTWPYNFGAVKDQNFDKAKVVIFPIPYDVTTSWRGGTREGPAAIIMASRQLDELFFVGANPSPIYTWEEVELSAGPGQEAIRGIEELVGSVLKKK